jgi:integrase
MASTHCPNSEGEVFMPEASKRIFTRREALLLSATAGIGVVAGEPALASDSIKTAAHQEPGNVSTPRSAIAKTQYGKVRGFLDGGVLTFKGVPYGATTAGENRWLPAKPPAPWTDEHPALVYGANCPQNLHTWTGIEQTFLFDWDGADVWVFRWYDYSSGKRVYKKQIIGNVEQMQSKRDAEKSVVALRSSINVDTGSPRTVADLDAHYRKYELTQDKKSFSTIENHRLLYRRYIEPRWDQLRLYAVRTVEVEAWLHSLVLAPASKAKIKCVLSLMYNHAIRNEWLLTPEEFQKLVRLLAVRERAMVLLAGSTGIRRSEMIALTWSDLDTVRMEVNILRSCVRNRIGKTKTESSCRPVPLHPLVLHALLEWRAKSAYAEKLDFLFPSPRFKGKRPLSPDCILQKSIRPAPAAIGIVGKQIGWHSFRHSLATNLRSLGVDIKVAQELMRHSSCRTPLDVYTRAVDQQKREANKKVVELMLPE